MVWAGNATTRIGCVGVDRSPASENAPRRVGGAQTALSEMLEISKHPPAVDGTEASRTPGYYHARACAVYVSNPRASARLLAGQAPGKE